VAAHDRKNAEGEETAREALEANYPKGKEPRGPQNGWTSEEGRKAKRGTPEDSNSLGA